MSFLILSFRKLSLKRKINNGNFRLMQLQMSQSKLQSQISEVQKLNAQIQDNWTTLTSSLGTSNSSIFNAQYSHSQQNVQASVDKYNEALKSGNEAEIANAKAAMEAAKNTETVQQKSLLEFQNNQAIALSAMKQSANSIFEASQKAELEDLQRKDQTLDLEKTSLEDQISTWNAEYSSLDKAVQDAAKNSAPKYC